MTGRAGWEERGSLASAEVMSSTFIECSSRETPLVSVRLCSDQALLFFIIFYF